MCVWVAQFTLRWKTRAHVNESVFNQCTDWRCVCVCSYFMHLECSWQRATGTLTTQEWKASRSVWLGLSRVRERGCFACTESSPHLHTHTHWSHQYNPSCTFTTKHFLEHGYTHSLKPNNFTSASPWVMNTLTQCDHPHSAAGRRHSNSFHMWRG